MTSGCCRPAPTRQRPLYRLVDAAYERRSLILTSKLHPARFDSIFPKGLATAAVDRLLHHAHVIVTEG
jgi:DNA replication protein DnaC